MKALKITGAVLTVLIILGLGGCFILNEKEPKGTLSADADKLAYAMMESVNKKAWDETRYVQFSFRGGHHYFWDKERNLVEVQWKKYRALVNAADASGKVWKGDKEITGEEAKELLTKARHIFFNDGFWFNAPVKAFDEGTQRSIVTLKDGREGLKIQYMEGGTTPGDSYVWILDDHYRPLSWKMWVQILPIGGLELQWQQWDTLSTGAIVAKLRHTKLANIEFTNVMAGQSLSDFGKQHDPFAEM